MSVKDLLSKMYDNVVELDAKGFASRFGDLRRLISVFDLPALKREGVSYTKIYGDVPFSMSMAIRVIDDVKNNGVVMPIIMSQDGVVIDGMSRLTALIMMENTKFPVAILPVKCREDWVPCVKVALSTLTNKGSVIYSRAVELLTPVFHRHNVELPIPNIMPVTTPVRPMRVEEIEGLIDMYSTVPVEIRDMAKSWIPSLLPVSRRLASHSPSNVAFALIYMAMKANCYMTRHNLGTASMKVLELLHAVPQIAELVNPMTLRNTCLNKCITTLNEFGVTDTSDVPQLFDGVLKVQRAYPLAAAATVYIKLVKSGVGGGKRVRWPADSRVKLTDVANKFNTTMIAIRKTAHAYMRVNEGRQLPVNG